MGGTLWTQPAQPLLCDRVVTGCLQRPQQPSRHQGPRGSGGCHHTWATVNTRRSWSKGPEAWWPGEGAPRLGPWTRTAGRAPRGWRERPPQPGPLVPGAAMPTTACSRPTRASFPGGERGLGEERSGSGGGGCRLLTSAASGAGPPPPAAPGADRPPPAQDQHLKQALSLPAPPFPSPPLMQAARVSARDYHQCCVLWENLHFCIYYILCRHRSYAFLKMRAMKMEIIYI